MQQGDLSNYKRLYIQTARDYLAQLEQSLITLKSDPTNAEAIETAHIAAHSIASQSIVMGYNSTSTICHSIEAYLQLVKDGSKLLNSEVVAFISGFVQKIKISIDSIEVNNKESDLTLDSAQMNKRLGS